MNQADPPSLGFGKGGTGWPAVRRKRGRRELQRRKKRRVRNEQTPANAGVQSATLENFSKNSCGVIFAALASFASIVGSSRSFFVSLIM